MATGVELKKSPPLMTMASSSGSLTQVILFRFYVILLFSEVLVIGSVKLQSQLYGYAEAGFLIRGSSHTFLGLVSPCGKPIFVILLNS